jgi:tRNA dimethylallyltransferase
MSSTTLYRINGLRGRALVVDASLLWCGAASASLSDLKDDSTFTEPSHGHSPAAGRHSRAALGTLPTPVLMTPSNSAYPLIAVLGPTASGKSALALAVAERMQGEVVNFDSIQIYRGCDVGAGKLTIEERRGIPHHLLDSADAAQTVTAGDYARQAERVLVDIRERGKLPVLVGGTGFYLRALLDGLFEGPQRSEQLRARLRARAERRGREFLHKMLRRFDPRAASRIEARDTQKLIRAVEVCILARQPISELQARGRQRLQGFRSVKVGLDPGRGTLYERIDRRVENMLANGLLDEVRNLLARPDSVQLKPLEALGYRQAAEYMRGSISLQEAIKLAQKGTRHYAKRQMTWFRRESGVTWFSGCGEDVKVQQKVLDHLEGILTEAYASGPPRREHE